MLHKMYSVKMLLSCTSQVTANKSLKAVRIRSLDSFSRRMLRILCAAFSCPLALR